MRPTTIGAILVGLLVALLLAVGGVTVLVGSRSGAAPEDHGDDNPAAQTRGAPAPAPTELGAGAAAVPLGNGDDPQVALARSLLARLAELVIPGRALGDDEQREIETLEGRLLALGDVAVAALIARLDGRKDAPASRERMFDLLRRMPGETVEKRLVAEARRGEQPAMTTMAIESLAARRTESSLTALGDIARNDPNLPARALIAAPRDPKDTSTELPDETVFSPRMQAMSALASTRDPRAVPVLADVVVSGPDEALRMEAARNLEGLRADPRAGAVLRTAAASDPSAYVRLAALHSLQGTNDPSLSAVLEGIAARDRDAGVRILAQQLLTDLRR